MRTLDLSEVSGKALHFDSQHEFFHEENSDFSDLKLLTMKPCIYAANVNEGDLRDEVRFKWSNVALFA